MSKYQTPCRYDFVGSFLRPEEVKKANADYQEGKISEAEKNQIIDKAVTEVVAKQKELGFHVITDGEFRRTYWQWKKGCYGYAAYFLPGLFRSPAYKNISL